MHNREQRVVKAREAMATAASVLLAGPEEAAAEFKVLLALLRDKEAQVQRLAMVTLLAVFKDVLPGYRIRPPSERELEVKVSKEVQKLRDYETRLLAHYQAYLKVLLAAAAPARSKAIGAGARGGQTQEAAGGGRTALVTARVAVKCMCQLLSCLAHFNYTPDLLQAVVPCMAASDPEVRSQACSAIRSLLAQPETSGKVALEAVQLVADLVRTRRCVCPPQVVQALSVLRFTEVTRRDPAEDGKRAKPTPKKGAKAPVKRPRSAIDEEVDRDFKESEAATDRRTVAALQSRMLEALFEVYFRVLKNCTSAPELLKPDVLDSNASRQANGNATATALVPALPSQQGPGDIVGAVAPGSGVPRDRLLKRHPLLYPTLEGLARYAHLISIDYFNDLMAVFHQLLRDCHLPLVEQLRVLLTVSDILRGQGEALTVDRKDFHVRLYLALLNIPLRGIAEGGPDGAPATQSGGQQGQGQGQVVPDHGGPGEGVKGEGAGPRRGEEQEEDDPPGTAELAAAAVLGLLGGGVQSERGVPLDSLTPGAPGATQERRQQQQQQQQQQQGVHPVACEEPLATLLAAVLSQMMCEPKIIDMARMAAFVKRCASVALSSPTPEAMALLGCILR
ncbi:nucleolar complex-associated protein-domain-containing protein [Haematococcus lacustris]